ncbi:MAG TPA: C4-dicarboxylic acid transporter DauA [Polyangiales bacterium]|nr:C4-dicarboxylic acid transporter DauA [Polyangiales bacterium]
MPRTRYQHSSTPTPLSRLPAAALRAVLREGYDARALRQDVLAGLVVGVVALPLAMALAIAVGVAPQHGLYTAMVAGFVAALLGGSRTQVSGPTAAFIVVLAPIHEHFGLQGLLLAGMLAGLLLIAMGLLRLGSLITYVPHPVTTGFTAGIATVIATLQLKDMLGISWAGSPQHYLERVAALWNARATMSVFELMVGAGTLALLILAPRVVKSLPAPVVVLPLAAALVAACAHYWPGFHVATIGSRFHTEIAGHVYAGIPQLLPTPRWPFAGIGLDTLRELFPSALTIAALGAIESLLSAVVADGMAHTKHDPDAELLAIGAGNLLAPLFGGIAATGAIARTATNVRSGARSPIAAMTHALVILLALLALAPLLAYLPMASLAALLMIVAWNMSEIGHFIHTLKVAPRSDVAVLLTCYALTVLVDMVAAVSVGIVLAALLFMHRMVEVTQIQLQHGTHPALPRTLPPGVMVYDIDGPLFFGAAQKAMGALGSIAGRAKVVVLRMEGVPALDATGLVALESALARLRASRCNAILCGLLPQPAAVLERAGLTKTVQVCPDIESAITAAEDHLATRTSLPPSA